MKLTADRTDVCVASPAVVAEVERRKAAVQAAGRRDEARLGATGKGHVHADEWPDRQPPFREHRYTARALGQRSMAWAGERETIPT